MESIAAARRSLRQNLDHSLVISSAIENSTRLTDLSHRLPSLSAAVRPIRSSAALSSVSVHINRSVGPSAAVLKVFDAIHGLEPSLLSDPQNDLPGYLSVLQRLQEALIFLSDNCNLAIHWLDDIVDYLDENHAADSTFLQKLKHSLRSLKNNPTSLDGGLLNESLSKLGSEFTRLLQEHASILSMALDSDTTSTGTITASPLPVHVIHNLGLILETMIANEKLESCIKIYIDIRGKNIRSSLKALDLNYLDISVSDFNNVQSIESHINNWGKHLEFTVKHLFETEYNLCMEVFNTLGPACFAEIAAQAGILAFFKFGNTVCNSKKDPIKLLKLLDIFSSLSKLRVDFNRLFGGNACIEIQNATRELIREVVEGSCDIFWELLVQVELQRQTSPPLDGGVPKLVIFITDYCNKLLSDKYRTVLTQVLGIHRSWTKQKFNDRILFDSVLSIVKALEANLETWSKGYDDQILSYLFLMSGHWHFFKHLKNTKVGELLGDPWLREQEQYKDYWAAFYLRESWNTLPPLLSREGLIMFSGGQATARDLVKKRVRAFNDGFDEMYRKHEGWVIVDKELREKICRLIVQTVVPVYRSYMQSYGALVQQEGSGGKYVKYTTEELEKMIGSLFQQKLKAASFRARYLNGS